MLEFLKSKKKAIVNLTLAIAVLLILSFGILFLLEAFNIITYEDRMEFNVELFNSFKDSWYGWLVVILLHIVVTTVLCFIPGLAMAFMVLIDALYPTDWQSFLVSFIAVMSSSMIMYLVGKYGGYKLCEKLLGEKDCKKAADLLNNKATVFFPLMMMFPVFPDDALVMLAGTFKMSLAWFVPSIVIGRGIGIATYVFGVGSIPFYKFTSPWHWIIFIAVCAVGVIGVFIGALKLNKYLEKRRLQSAEQPESTATEFTENPESENITLTESETNAPIEVDNSEKPEFAENDNT